MIERPPRARGPNSMRPCSRPMTFSDASSAAISSATFDGSNRRATMPRLSMKAWISASLKRGPRNDPLMPSEYFGPPSLARGAGASFGAVSPERPSAAKAEVFLERSQVPADSGLTRGWFRCRCQMLMATPSAPPASPAAGCTNTWSNGPSRRMRPLPTQFNATPPARHKSRMPVCLCAKVVIFSMTSSVISWIDRARSISRWVSGLSGLRAGPPNTCSIFEPVIVKPAA